MATLTNKPNLSSALLDSITRNKIWNETSLQYYFGGRNALSLDGEFRSAFHGYMGSGDPDGTFAYARLATRAYSMIDAVTVLDFIETRNAANADHVLVSADKPKANLEGFFQFPGMSTHDGTGGMDAWSIGAFNSGVSYMHTKPEAGGGEYANWTVLHEIGHGLGLLHTHDDTTGYALPTIGRAMDNERYSVMSYKGASDGLAFGHAVSFMALDVASIQALYGAEANAVGSSTYTLMNAKGGQLSLREGDVSIGRAYYCIWDSGGVDTINYKAGGKSVMINLNDATLDTGGISADLKALFSQLKDSFWYGDLSKSIRDDIVDKWHHAGGFFSQVLDTKNGSYRASDGGYSIANGAEIENAVGGVKQDFLLGNEQGNSLRGLGGDDTMLGSSGADRLYGGEGRDWLDGGYGKDVLMGSAAGDIFVFSEGYGTDTIKDFTHADVIYLRDLGVEEYSDIKSRMTEVNGDVVITFGSDQLVIAGFHISQLSVRDFAI